MKDAREPVVLIVGAGPTGLAAALALAKLGVSVRLIDRNAGPSTRSKALGVQAGTLECLEAAIGPEIVREMLAAGRPAREAWIHLDAAAPIRIDLASIPSAYPFILILAQSETERILETHLARGSVRVERETELVSFAEIGEKIVAKIRLPSGEIEEVRSSFLIGADGAHSAVRHGLDLPFEGAAYEGTFVLGDVTLGWPWPYDSIRTFVSEQGVIASFPMKGDRRYRLILIPRGAPAASDDADIGLDEFRAITERLGAGKIRVESADWLTRFRVHHRMVRHFGKGRAFLAGDAAHIHSPAGGQGMNTGIQDALNLAFKLSAVLSGDLPFSRLADYERERVPVARGVLHGTDFVFRMALLPESRAVAWFRRVVLPKIIGSGFVQRRMAAAISEVAIARREIRRYPRGVIRKLRS